MSTSGLTVRKIANLEDETTGDAYEVFEFDKVGGRHGKLRVTRDEARTASKLTSLLINKNWDAPADDKRMKSLVQKAIASKPERLDLSAAHVGWRNRHRTFVLHDDVITRPGKRLSLVPPLWLNSSQHVFIASRGSLEEWIENVAKPARYSTRVMLLMSAALAAPLVSLMALQPFGINLFGRSKVGKTTALLAACSAIGIGRESELHNWNRTSAAAQEVARALNDLLVPLNEAALINGKKTEAYSEIRQQIYQFAEGRERSRHSASSYAVSRVSSTWSGIFVSTSERSFNDYASDSAQTRDDGEFARCIDVPAIAEGHSTIFDRTPKDIQDIEVWSRKTLIDLRHACDAYRGVPIREHVRHLIAEHEVLKKTVEEDMREFLESASIPNTEGALQHAARNMAIIYSGGCRGIESKLLPWKRDRLREAVLGCLKDAIADLRECQGREANAIEVFRGKLKSARLERLRKNSNFGPANLDGYYIRRNGDREYTIKVTAFTEWLTPVQQRAVLDQLINRKLLRDGKSRRDGRQQSRTDKAADLSVQRRWPNGKNPRCYVFADPFGMA